MNQCNDFDSDNQDNGPVKRMGGKSASARSKPLIQKALDDWLEKSNVSREDWENGQLFCKKLVEVPPLLPDGLDDLMLSMYGNKIKDVSGLCLPDDLEHLMLNDNLIEDVSELCLPDSLQYLVLWMNKIKDVSTLRLPDGLEYLDLSSNQIEDISGLCLSDSLQYLNLSNNQIPEEKRYCLKVPDGCTVEW